MRKFTGSEYGAIVDALIAEVDRDREDGAESDRHLVSALRKLTSEDSDVAEEAGFAVVWGAEEALVVEMVRWAATFAEHIVASLESGEPPTEETWRRVLDAGARLDEFAVEDGREDLGSG